MQRPSHIARWVITDQLGAGGVAEVLLGRSDRPSDPPEVAIKRPLPERRNDASYRAMIAAEARILGRIQHPNVVRAIEFLDIDPPALVLERMHGRTLGQILGEDPPTLPAALVLDIGTQAAEALAAVHAATDEDGQPLGVVHCDVSPENLFITTEGTVKLFDFNVSSVRGLEPAPGTLRGRIAYMAPEQARSERLEARADVFSLAVVLWELLAGERLFWRGNTLASLRAVCEDTVPGLETRCRALPDGLAELVSAALSRDVFDRPDAATMARRLAALHTVDPQHRDVAALLTRPLRS